MSPSKDRYIDESAAAILDRILRSAETGHWAIGGTSGMEPPPNARDAGGSSEG